MSVNLRFTALARAAVLSAALALPAATAAHADGDFNISRESAIVQSAASAPAAPLTAAQSDALAKAFYTGRNDAFGGVTSAQLSPATLDVNPRLASTVPTVGGKRDLVGAGGHQDELANKIYQPGHTVGTGG